MLTYLKELYERIKIKRYSNSLTEATEGSSVKDPIATKTKEISKKCNNQIEISLDEINHILTYELGLNTLKTTTFKFNDLLATNMAFSISSFYIQQGKDDSIVDVRFTLKEFLLGGTLTISMSGRELFELMTPIQQTANKQNIH